MLASPIPCVTIPTDERLAEHVNNFNPEKYLAMSTLSKPINNHYYPMYTGLAKLFHEVFSGHAPGERLLDVGSGPTLWHVMSASAKYRNITLSDPLPQNRQMQMTYMRDGTQDNR
jgi:hypothetical protein